jgi:hypothetical protein
VTLALIIFTAIMVQIAVFVWLRLRRAQLQQTKVTEDSCSSSQEDVTVAHTFSWEGFREFTVQRKVFEDSAHSICSFYLVSEDNHPLPPFKPGQFLTFRLLVVDPSTGKSKTIIRCYSLSDVPYSGFYRVSIKRIPSPANSPDIFPGLSSNYFHDHVVEGSKLEVRAPSGHFHLQENSPLPIVLIAGGIGITPMLSMVNTLLGRGDKRKIWLFYGVRNSSEHIMKTHLQTLAKDINNFNLCVCYSAPGENDIEGVDYHHRGRVDIPLLQNRLKHTHHQFYVCGPKAMMESVVPGLDEWGVHSEDIFYESFGQATLIKQNNDNKMTVDTGSKTITFQKSDKSFEWNTDSGSILEFAEANGVKVESGCRAGSCGGCQTKIAKGEVVYKQQPDADVEEGHCLLCISTPKNNLTLIA